MPEPKRLCWCVSVLLECAMSRRMLAIVMAWLMGAALTLQVKGADDPDAPWETAKDEGYALAAPKGWSNLDKFSPQVLIFRKSDGNGGVPKQDENGAELSAQISVEKIRMEPNVEDSANVVAMRILDEPQTEVVRRPSGEKITLSDGTEAFILNAEVIRNGTRKILILKLLAKCDAKNGFVVTGTITGGKESSIPAASSNLGKWLKAMVGSFVLDSSKLDAAKVNKAYQERDKK